MNILMCEHNQLKTNANNLNSKQIHVSLLHDNGSPSKNHGIKTPLVMSFTSGVGIHFSPLAAFWCKGSSKDSKYNAIHFKISNDEKDI